LGTDINGNGTVISDLIALYYSYTLSRMLLTPPKSEKYRSKEKQRMKYLKLA
jgi:hypothetical protein